MTWKICRLLILFKGENRHLPINIIITYLRTQASASPSNPSDTTSSVIVCAAHV